MSEVGQHGSLMGGVPALDIEGLVGLGVAKRLGFFEDYRIRETLALHAGENVVTRAVQDTVDAAEAIRDQTLAQRLDDGNAAGD